MLPIVDTTGNWYTMNTYDDKLVVITVTTDRWGKIEIQEVQTQLANVLLDSINGDDAVATAVELAGIVRIDVIWVVTRDGVATWFLG